MEDKANFQEELENETINSEAEEVNENTQSSETTDSAENTEDAAQTADEENIADSSETETSEESKNDSAEDAKEEKGGFFKKKNKTDKRDEQIADLTDRVKRQMAEFENFRRRTDKEKSQMYEMGAKATIEKILPVVDNFERGLSAIPEGEGDAFAEGMRMTYKQLMTALEEMGVTPIEAVGKEFDPDLHNAVMHIEDENYGENEIVAEFQKGYKYRDSVVRHSMVQVAN